MLLDMALFGHGQDRKAREDVAELRAEVAAQRTELAAVRRDVAELDETVRRWMKRDRERERREPAAGMPPRVEATDGAPGPSPVPGSRLGRALRLDQIRQKLAAGRPAVRIPVRSDEPEPDQNGD